MIKHEQKHLHHSWDSNTRFGNRLAQRFKLITFINSVLYTIFVCSFIIRCYFTYRGYVASNEKWMYDCDSQIAREIGKALATSFKIFGVQKQGLWKTSKPGPPLSLMHRFDVHFCCTRVVGVTSPRLFNDATLTAVFIYFRMG
jgi:hypothetical protein